jgi:hypothetical protein
MACPNWFPRVAVPGDGTRRRPCRKRTKPAPGSKNLFVTRLSAERLDDRICPSSLYSYSVFAKTGDGVTPPGSGTSAGTLTNISLASINDSGNVGFLGTLNNGFSGVDEAGLDANGNVYRSVLSFTSRNFTFPQIDNNNEIISQDLFNTSTFIRVWSATGVGTTRASSTSSSDILVLPAISPDGSHFAYIDVQSGTDVLEIDGSPSHTFPAGTGGLRPMIANNGAVVVRDGSTTTSPIKIFLRGHPTITVADSTRFSLIGNNPGIDAGGNVVAFFGVLADAAGLNSANSAALNNAAALNPSFSLHVNPLAPGAGIFVNVPIDASGDRVTVRLAGVSGNRSLDPGETWTGGSDNGVLSAFPDARVLPTAEIGFDANGDLKSKSSVGVTFIGTDAGGVNQGIYTSSLGIGISGLGPLIATVSNPIEVINSGQTINGIGQVTGVSVSFPSNSLGQVAFIAGTASGQAVVVADPLGYISPTVADPTLHPPTLKSYTPSQIRHAYGIDTIPGFVDGQGTSHLADGTGQTIAIVDYGNDPTIVGDLDAFDTQFAGQFGTGTYGPASSILTVVDQAGNLIPDPLTDSTLPKTNSADETALDVEWTHAVAPGAKIVLIEFTGIVFDAMAEAARLADPLVSANLGLPAPVSVVSISYGYQEFPSEHNQYDGLFDTPPVTYLASSGDEGAPGDYPAFSPDVVATGGTSLYLNQDNSYASESGWGASNGSISDSEGQPLYQKGIVSAYSTTNRTIPDVSFVADPASGIQYYDSYSPTTTLYPSHWGTTGGTSLSAPCWAGIVAIANQGRVLSGKKVLAGSESTLSALYQVPAADYHDVTVGNNAQYTLSPGTEGRFSTAPGYDMVTGLGSPVANRLVPDLVAFKNDQWTGKGSDNLWSNPDNWLGRSVPLAGADVIFPAGALRLSSDDDLSLQFHSITTDDAYIFAGQSIRPDAITVRAGSLEIDGFAAPGGAIQVDANTTLKIGGGELDVSGGLTAAGTVQVGGLLHVLNGGTFDSQSTVSVLSSGQLLNDGAVTVESGSNVDILGTVSIGSQFTPTFAAAGTITVEQSGTLLIGKDETVDVTGTLTVRGMLQSAGTADLSPAGMFDLFGNATFSSTGNFLAAGPVTVEAGGKLTDLGTVVVSAQFTAAGTVEIGAGGLFSVGNGRTLTVSGTLTDAGDLQCAGTIVVSSGAQLTVNGSAAVSNGGTFTADGSVTVGPHGIFADSGAVKFEGFANLVVQGNLTVTPSTSLDLFSAAKIDGGQLDDQGTVTVGAVDTLDDEGLITVAPGAALEVEGKLTIGAAGDVVDQGTITADSGATLDDGGTVTVSSAAHLDLFGHAVIQSAGMLADQGTVHVGPTGTLDSFGTAQIDSGATLDDTGMVTIETGAGVNVQGVFTIESIGDLVDQGTITVGMTGTLDDLAAAGTALVDVGGLIAVDGKLIVEHPAALDIKGTVEIHQGGTLNNRGTITVEATGLLSDQDAIAVAAGAVIDVHGTLTEAAGGALAISGNVTVRAGATLNDSSTVTVVAGGVLDDYGALTIAPSGLLDIFGSVLLEGGATYSPQGTVMIETGGSITNFGSQPPAITIQPGSLTVTADQPASFTAAASGSPAPTVQWQVSGDGGVTFADIPGATSTTYTLAATAPADNGKEYRAVFSNGVGSPAVSHAATLTVSAPTIVAGIQINGGAMQRSEVRSISVTLSGLVTFSGGDAASAFQLVHVQTNVAVNNLAAAVSTNGGGQTVVTLSFTTTGNAATEVDPISTRNSGAASLADGRYQLTIDSTRVRDANGAGLDGDGNGAAGGNYISPADTYLGNGLHLYRLFGDASGDGVVDATDLGQFRSTFNANNSQANYLSFLDSDNSGAVDASDLGQFRVRFNANVF